MSISIRRRLAIRLVAIMVLGWLLMVATNYLVAEREVEELFDAQLAQSARILHALVKHELDENYYHQGDRIQLQYDLPGHYYESRIAFRILDRKGGLSIQSDSFPDIETGQKAGFSNIDLADDRWRLFVMEDATHNVTLEVAQHFEPREELVRDIAYRSMQPLVIVLPVIVLLIWISIGRGLRPLNASAAEIANRTPANLQPINERTVPQEVLPLIQALNVLFDRLRQAMENEHRFTMDAAHELRTPLAAIKTQAQVALRAQSDDVRQQALEQIVSGVDRTSHLVRQLLILARVDPDASIQEYEKLDLGRMLERVAADITPLADDKQITLDIHTENPGKKRILGQRQLIEVLARNLLDNAVRYTPHGGRVECRVEVTDTHARLTIRDNGPGVPADSIERIFDRFYRVLGTEQRGSGLGLSIVKRIAELHSAEIQARSRTEQDPGLTIEVWFPLRPSLSS